MPVVIPEGVPEEAAARKALAFEGTTRRLVAGRASRFMLAVWGFVSGALFLGHLAGLPGAVSALALSVFFFAWLERRWAVAAARRTLDETVAEISLGRLPEAEGALTALRGAFWVRRAWARTIAFESAIVATRRGDLELARAHLDEALVHRWRPGDPGAAHEREAALALRALVLASSGEIELAEADIDAVRAGDASDEALARASLAEALVLQRAGERDLLRGLLEEDGDLMREALHPRERVMVRALNRWSRAPRVTPYRHAERAVPAEEPPIETWVERLAPDLAGFVDATARVRLGPSPLAPNLAAAAPTHAGLRAIHEARRTRGSPLWPLLAIAVGAFGAMGLMLLSAPPTAPGLGGATPSGNMETAGLFALVALAIGGFVSWSGRDARRTRERLRRDVVRQRARALTCSSADLAALTESSDALTAAHAALAMAESAERKGRWTDVLAKTEKGLQRVAKRSDASMVVGDLVSLRAFALSICDRQGEAEAELATIARGYPHGPHALLRVRLVEAIRRGKLGDAHAQLERHAADLPLSIREEALADMVRVVGGAVGAADAARLAAELTHDARLRTWLDGVAPTLLARFEEPGTRGDERVRIAPACAPGEAKDDAEENVIEDDRLVEGLAEEECHQGSSSASTARFTS
jgi:hypothetical protein